MSHHAFLVSRTVWVVILHAHTALIKLSLEFNVYVCGFLACWVRIGINGACFISQEDCAIVEYCVKELQNLVHCLLIQSLSPPLGLKSWRDPAFFFRNSKYVFPVSPSSSRSTKFCWQEHLFRTQWRSFSAYSTSWNLNDSHLNRRLWLNLETWRLRSR